MATLIRSELKKKDLLEAVRISDLIWKEIKEEISTKQHSPYSIDILVGNLCKDLGVESSFKGEPSRSGDFPSNLCAMINDGVIHNIPSSKKLFEKEDIIHIDFGIKYKGLNTDHGESIYLGSNPEKKRLVETVKLSVENAISVIKPGIKTGDISFRIQSITELSGFKSMRRFCGHAVGEKLHESPKIPFVGRRGEGEIIEEGMVLAIENWITKGSGYSTEDADGWSIYTKENTDGAFYETMVLVESNGIKRLTTNGI